MGMDLDVELGILFQQLGQIRKGMVVLVPDLGFVKIPVDFGQNEILGPWNGGASGLGGSGWQVGRHLGGFGCNGCDGGYCRGWWNTKDFR